MRTFILHQAMQHDGGSLETPTNLYSEDPKIAKAMAGTHGSTRRVPIILADHLDEAERANKAATALRALDKLQPKERTALGMPTDEGEALAQICGTGTYDKENAVLTEDGLVALIKHTVKVWSAAEVDEIIDPSVTLEMRMELNVKTLLQHLHEDLDPSKM